MIGGTSADEIDALIGASSAPRALLESSGAALPMLPIPTRKSTRSARSSRPARGCGSGVGGRLAKLAAAEPRVAEAGPAVEACGRCRGPRRSRLGAGCGGGVALGAAVACGGAPACAAAAGAGRSDAAQGRCGECGRAYGGGRGVSVARRTAGGGIGPGRRRRTPRRRGAADRGAGLPLAIELGRRNEAILTPTSHPEDWADLQNKLGLALADLAGQAEDPAGPLAEAAAAFRSALEVRAPAADPEALGQDAASISAGCWSTRPSRSDAAAGAGASRRGGDGLSRRAPRRLREHRTPVGWAITQNFLGMALARRADRTEGQAGMALLAEAATAHRAALEVYDEAEDPEMRAYTRFNLGRALSELGERTEGDAGVGAACRGGVGLSCSAGLLSGSRSAGLGDDPDQPRQRRSADQAGRTGGPEAAGLLDEAEAAYRAALEVYTRDPHPEDWAMAQNNLGAHAGRPGGADRGGGGGGTAGDAVAALRAALEVRTRAERPFEWASTQYGLGNALVRLAALVGAGGRGGAARRRRSRRIAGRWRSRAGRRIR